MGRTLDRGHCLLAGGGGGGGGGGGREEDTVPSPCFPKVDKPRNIVSHP
jgi:hypothetical protein